MKHGKKPSFANTVKKSQPCAKCGARPLAGCKSADGRCPGIPAWLSGSGGDQHGR